MTDPSPDSIAARLTAEIRDRINQTMADQIMHESELGAYDLEAVLELGRHVV